MVKIFILDLFDDSELVVVGLLCGFFKGIVYFFRLIVVYCELLGFFVC